MARLVWLALAAVVVLVPAHADADAIAIPDTPCPEGSTRRVAGHGGSWCAPVPCAAGASCEGTCRDVALCVGEGTHYVHHGRLATSPPPTPERHVVAYGPCRADGTCAEGACTHEPRCVSAPSPAPPPTQAPVPRAPIPHASSSSCAVGARGRAPLAPLACLLLLSFRRAARTCRASRPAAARRCG